MNFSRTQILLFFLALLLLGGFLYPRELFLAYIYEGSTDLKKAEIFYKNYLQKKPNNKFGVTKLAQLYERIGTPEKALPLMEKLLAYRKNDWEFARFYLNYLENMHDPARLYKAQLEIGSHFAKNTQFVRKRALVSLLDDTFQYALWAQKTDDVYELLNLLVKLAPEPQTYISAINDLDMVFGHTDRVIKRFEEDLRENPLNEESRLELASVYLVAKDKKSTLRVINDGLKLTPNSLALRKLLVHVYDVFNDQMSLIQAILGLLEQSDLTHDERTKYMIALALAYVETKQNEKALTILDLVPATAETMMGRINIYEDMNRYDDAIKAIDEFLKNYPDRLDIERMKIAIMLYDKKDLGATATYLDFLKRVSDVQLAYDVAYLCIEKKRDDLLILWLNRTLQIFPHDAILSSIFLDQLIKVKKMDVALQFALDYLKVKPRDDKFLLIVAEIYSQRFDSEKANSYFDLWIKVKGHNFANDLFMGKQMFALNRLENALSYFDRAAQYKNTTAEVWYWLGEVKHAMDNKKLSKREFAKMVELLDGQSVWSQNLYRLRLRSKARLHWDDDVNLLYLEAFKKYPRDADLRYDYVEMLIVNRRLKEADAQIKQWLKIFPSEKGKYKLLCVQYDFAKHHWEEVIVLLKALQEEEPLNPWHDRDLAEAYRNAGYFSKAYRQYEKIAGRGDKNVDKNFHELKRMLDDRVKVSFDYQKLGSDSIVGMQVDGSYFIGLKYELHGSYSESRYSVPSFSFDDWVPEAHLGFKWNFEPRLTIDTSMGVAISGLRDAFYPDIDVLYRLDRVQFGLNGFYRKLRTDVPQAVRTGALEDGIGFSSQFQIDDNISLLASYDIDRTYLSGGGESVGHAFQTDINFDLLKKPYLSVGYEFRYSHQSDQGGFLAQFPLVPVSNAHYLTVRCAYEFKDQLKLETGFFLGEDFERDLHFFQADLWGVNASIQWQISHWLDLQSFYSYGRETSTISQGSSHSFNVGLMVRW